MQSNRRGSIIPPLALALGLAGCATTTHEAVGSVQPPPAPRPTVASQPADAVPAGPVELPVAAATAEAPPPVEHRALQEGSWRIAAGSAAFLETRDVGNGDVTNIGLDVMGGKMLTDQLMIEGIFAYNYSKFSNNNAPDSSTSLFDIGAGARYYFLIDGKTKPYARANVGLTFASEDLSGGGSNSDTAPFLGLAAGAETFFTEHFSLDYGLRLQQNFDLFGEDTTAFGLFVGLAIWF